MKQELKDKILEYNRQNAQAKEQAEDLYIIISGLRKLPHGQLKKILTEEVISVLTKYGVSVE